MAGKAALRHGGQGRGRRPGVALAVLAVLLLSFLTPLHATAQLRSALGADSLPFGLFGSVQLCGDHAGDKGGDAKGFCEHCVTCGRLLQAAPLPESPTPAWRSLPERVAAEAAAAWGPRLPQHRPGLPEVRGPPSV